MQVVTITELSAKEIEKLEAASKGNVKGLWVAPDFNLAELSDAITRMFRELKNKDYEQP